MKISSTQVYRREIARLLTPDEAEAVERHLAETWRQHPVIPGSGGMRKARIALPGRGKRGGGRIIFYVWVSEDHLFLMAAYAKNVREDLDPAQLKQLKSILDALRSKP